MKNTRHSTALALLAFLPTITVEPTRLSKSKLPHNAAIAWRDGVKSSLAWLGEKSFALNLNTARTFLPWFGETS